MSSSSTTPAPALGAPPATKLTRGNFLYWKTQVLPALRAARVMGLLEGSDPAPLENLEVEDDNKKKTTVPNPTYDVWITKDQQVVSYLVNSLSEEVLAQVFGLEHAADVWGALTAMHTTQSKARVTTLRGALTNTKKEELTAAQYIAKMKGFASELVAAGKGVDDDELRDYILNGLDSGYNSLVASINAVPTTMLHDMCSQLEAYDLRQQMLAAFGQNTGSFSSSVNAATRGRYNRGGGQQRYGGRDDRRGRDDRYDRRGRDDRDDRHGRDDRRPRDGQQGRRDDQRRPSRGGAWLWPWTNSLSMVGRCLLSNLQERRPPCK